MGKQPCIEKAENLANCAKKIFETNFGLNCLQLSTVYSLLGHIHQFKNENDLAIKHLMTAKNIKTEKLGANHVEIAQCLNNLGTVYLKSGDMNNALTAFEDAYNLVIA